MTKDVNADPRKIKAAAMLASGLPPAKVAEALNVSLRTIHRWQREPTFADLKSDVTARVADETIKTTVQNLNQEIKPIISYDQKKKFISQQCEQLDTAVAAIMPLVQEGDLQAIDRLVKLLDRKSKLFGLDQKTVEIGAAIATLSQFGIIRESQASSAFQALDEAESKLSAIGLDQ